MLSAVLSSIAENLPRFPGFIAKVNLSEPLRLYASIPFTFAGFFPVGPASCMCPHSQSFGGLPV